MKLQATKSVDNHTFQQFFGSKLDILEDHQLKEYGYFVIIDNKKLAFFALVPVDSQNFWLRAFVMKENAPVTLPVMIIQSAEELAKYQGAENVYIHSSTKAVDDLLAQLNYQTTDKGIIEGKSGQWWINTQVNVDKKESYQQK
ncbi:hypothetical protein [Gracilibacillus sp. YIM 98692]|uniref:hypothetical protein n=1 Tax=Gracilibacillus sp. YIM 98692 TaxID=2663532 RepID=UPI0013CFA77C|nr:hypothetical protein [Gracilibacillus sp. YIM 98692]